MKVIPASICRPQCASALGLAVCLLIFGSLSTADADVEARESGARVVKGSGEYLIEAPPRAEVDWSPADLALREAMAADPTFTTEMRSGLTQAGAVAGWKQFLQRSDLTKEQQVFAWWRLGSLYAYNFDRSRGETADWEQAERAMEQVRRIVPGLVSEETLNSATVFAGIPGAPSDQARRLAGSFNWLATRSEGDVDNSVSRVNRMGYVIDERHLSGGGKRDQTVEERKQFLRKLLADSRKVIRERITQHIQYSQDPAAIAELLKATEDTADPQIMETWREMHRELSAKFSGGEVSWGASRIIFVTLNVAAVAILAVFLVRRRRRV